MGGIPLSSGRVYDSANTGDIEEAVSYIQESNPDRILVGAACSLGGAILANYVAKQGAKCPLKCAVGVNICYNTRETTKWIQNLFFGAYDFVLGLGLRTMAFHAIEQANKFNRKAHPERVLEQEDAAKCTKMTDTPHMITVVINKQLYKDVDDYLDQADVFNKMNRIKVPFFFLSAIDDPIMGPYIPEMDDINENVIVGQTKYGGHCGYFTGRCLPVQQWFPAPTFEFIDHFVT